MPADCYRIMVKRPTDRVWYNLTPKGGLNRLKIHASQYTDKERAAKAAAILMEDNPGAEAKVLPF